MARDLTPYGGFRIEAIADLAARYHGVPVEIIHVGGEILTTTAWQAAVMLAEPEEASGLIARFDTDPVGARTFATERFGLTAAAPYVIGRELFPAARRIVFNAVGGADLAHADASLRREVLAKLAGADSLFVRDRATQAALAEDGIAAALAPDPVAVIAERFGARIAQETTRGEVAGIRSYFPAGFVAVQFAAECGDDATLDSLARGFDAIAAETGWGIVFFRAGTAPWHDDLDAYRRCAARLATASWRIFAALDVWQIAALIAASQGFAGTSLHGHIVATAFALPRVSFLPPSLAGRSNKLAAYLATWEMPEMPGVVDLARLAEGFARAIGVAAEARQSHAHRLAQLYRRTAADSIACIRSQCEPGQ
ncbi:polysaccharide pyruvyl transferase family protein [Sulfuricystis multivorans]|uniref:polysaccharide pyruvyl transferase family protein n=1 Tax=Sulfuricystis multivorans TaxID=2211108 RepID=UPI000F82B875|nr:polysaccharide pyruvyl transferase family protein [Sulfuricystis multivorans]